MFGISNTNYGKIDYNRLRSSQEELNQNSVINSEVTNNDNQITYISEMIKDPNVRYNNFIRYIVKKDAAPGGK
jgi:hypothetical protein